MTVKTQFETDIVGRYKNGESSYQIGKDEGCSYNAVLRELKRRGVDTGLRFWTKEEKEKLKKLYPISSNEDLLKEFPNRTKETIGSIVSNLGLKKKECKTNCKGCREEFITKYKHKRELCLKCVKKQWEYNNPEKARERQKRWIQRNPEYVKKYREIPKNREHINRYFRQRRKENPRLHLDQNMCNLICQSLKGKKVGWKWETLVSYTLKDLMERLEKQFDDKMNWDNYGNYWHIDHIRPRSLFKYTSPDDPEFKKCWALENVQPLEKIANLRKGNTL